MTAYELTEKFKNGNEEEQESILRYILYYHTYLDLKYLDNLFQYNKIHIGKWQRTVDTFIEDLFYERIRRYKNFSKKGTDKLSKDFFAYIYEIFPIKTCSDVDLFIRCFEINLDKDYYKNLLIKLFQTNDFDILFKKKDIHLDKLLHIFSHILGEDYVKSVLFIHQIGGNL